MVAEGLLMRISIDPNICAGKPCIRGHRIGIEIVLGYLAGGSSIEEVLIAYPSIDRDDVLACIAYGAEMARDCWAKIPIIDLVLPLTNRSLENEQDLPTRINFNPQIFGGKPIIRGRRLAVEQILEMLAAGDTDKTLLAAYPWLELADIQACLIYACRLVEHQCVETITKTII